MPAVSHILFPYDFSAQATQIAPVVRAFASRVGAKVTLFSVVGPTWEPLPEGMPPLVGNSPEEWKDGLKAQLDRVLLAELGEIAVERVADAGDPALRIAAYGEANGVDLIMMPTRGLGLFRSFLVGSVTGKVLHDVRCPVWTAAHPERAVTAVDLPRTVLCAVDGSDQTPALLRWAGGFSRDIGATLTLLHVVGSVSDWPSIASERALQEEVRHEAQQRIRTMQQSVGIDAPLRVVVGDVVPAVTSEAAQEDAGLLIIGRGLVSEPLGRLRTNVFGIIQRSPCPVLSV